MYILVILGCFIFKETLEYFGLVEILIGFFTSSPTYEKKFILIFVPHKNLMASLIQFIF